jgi:hypothetical protein
MLNSKSPEFPSGVGSSSGLLGRYLLDHMAVSVSGFMPEPRELCEGRDGQRSALPPSIAAAHLQGFRTDSRWKRRRSTGANAV